MTWVFIIAGIVGLGGLIWWLNREPGVKYEGDDHEKLGSGQTHGVIDRKARGERSSRDFVARRKRQ